MFQFDMHSSIRWWQHTMVWHNENPFFRGIMEDSSFLLGYFQVWVLTKKIPCFADYLYKNKICT